MFEYLLNNYFPGLCEEHPPRPSHDRSSTRVREQEFWLWRGFFIWTYCLPWYNSRLQLLCVLFPRRLNNCRRVAYEEVRLPPATNQRCDLYVDDEVEVSLKLWENLFGNRPDSGHVIKLRKGHSAVKSFVFIQIWFVSVALVASVFNYVMTQMRFLCIFLAHFSR